MKVKIDIETGTFTRFWAVLLGFAALLGAVFLARDALILIGIALFLALALNPPVSWLAKKLPGKSRIGATAIAYLLVVTTIGLIAFLVIPPIVEQTAKFAKTVPDLIDKVASQRQIVDNFVDHYNLHSAVDQAIENAKQKAAATSEQLGTVLVTIVGSAVGSLVNLMFILVLGFFMLVEGPMWVKKLWGLYEDVDTLEDHKTTVDKMYRVVTGFVNGQITVATIGASCAFVALLVMSAIPGLGIPPNLALPIAVIVFIFEIIPMVGAIVATVLSGLILLLNSPIAALVFLIYYVLYQQVENNVIAPRIQAKNVDLSVLWILMAIIIGASLFGIIGGLVSIPIAGCLRVLLVDYLEHAEKRRAADARNPIARLLKKKDA